MSCAFGGRTSCGPALSHVGVTKRAVRIHEASGPDGESRTAGRAALPARGRLLRARPDGTRGGRCKGPACSGRKRAHRYRARHRIPTMPFVAQSGATAMFADIRGFTSTCAAQRTILIDGDALAALPPDVQVEVPGKAPLKVPVRGSRCLPGGLPAKPVGEDTAPGSLPGPGHCSRIIRSRLPVLACRTGRPERTRRRQNA